MCAIISILAILIKALVTLVVIRSLLENCCRVQCYAFSNFQEEIQKPLGRNLKLFDKKSKNRREEIILVTRRGRLLENRCGVQCYELLIGQNCKFQHKSKRGRRSQRPFVI